MNFYSYVVLLCRHFSMEKIHCLVSTIHNNKGNNASLLEIYHPERLAAIEKKT